MKKEIEEDEIEEIEEEIDDEDEVLEEEETKPRQPIKQKQKFIPKPKEVAKEKDRFSAFHLPERVGILDNETQQTSEDLMIILAGIKNDLFEIKQAVGV